MAEGYTQTYRIDYTETFTLVAKINTVRVLLSLAVNLDWPLQQFNVKKAFLHGELAEEVYLDLPPRCMTPKSWKVLFEETAVGVQTFSESVVRMVHKVYDSIWLPSKQFRSYITHCSLFMWMTQWLQETTLKKGRHCRITCPKNLKWKILVPWNIFLGSKFLDQLNEFFYLKESMP